MWPVSLDCSILMAHTVIPNVYLFFVFVLCLVYPVWPVSLGCSFLMAHTVISNVYLFCVLCIQCGQSLLIVHSWWPIPLSLTFICFVCIRCVLCIQCGQCLLVVHSWWLILLSLTFICCVCIRSVSCVSNVASVSWLLILDAHTVITNIYVQFKHDRQRTIICHVPLLGVEVDSESLYSYALMCMTFWNSITNDHRYIHIISTCMTCRVCNKNYTMGATRGAGEPEFTHGFILRVRVAQSLVFCVVFCKSLLVLFSLGNRFVCTLQ